MKMHKFEVYIVDFEDYGVDEIKSILESDTFDCCVKVFHDDTSDIGKWSDDHKFNMCNTPQSEYQNEFSKSCPYCDNTGDVHRADGEYLGECTECIPCKEREHLGQPATGIYKLEIDKKIAELSSLVEQIRVAAEPVLEEVMSIAVANGANSVSMPEQYVALAYALSIEPSSALQQDRK